MNQKKILIVEDEAIIALELESKLQSHGYNLIYFSSTGAEAIQIAYDKKPDVILMDITLKGKMNGIEAARKIHQNHKIPIIYMTGNSHFRSDKKLLKTNPVKVLSKPASDWEIFSAIEKALDRQIN